MSVSLENKVALVTGANRGIGSAIVESFIKSGASKVYATARKLDTLQPLVDKYGDKIVPVFLDVSQESTVTELAQQAQDVQIVVNNAGVLEIADPLNPEVEQHFKFELEVNVFGLLRVAQAFAPIIEKNGQGAFVQLNSVASVKNFTPFTTYCASKAAAYSITQGLKELLEPKGIQVLSVHPGPINTDMGDKAGFEGQGDAPSVVGDGIVEALKNGEFHLFPDTMAKEIWGAYQSFGQNVVEVAMTEA